MYVHLTFYNKGIVGSVIGDTAISSGFVIQRSHQVFGFNKGFKLTCATTFLHKVPHFVQNIVDQPRCLVSDLCFFFFCTLELRGSQVWKASVLQFSIVYLHAKAKFRHQNVVINYVCANEKTCVSFKIQSHFKSIVTVFFLILQNKSSFSFNRYSICYIFKCDY